MGALRAIGLGITALLLAVSLFSAGAFHSIQSVALDDATVLQALENADAYRQFAEHAGGGSLPPGLVSAEWLKGRTAGQKRTGVCAGRNGCAAPGRAL